MRGKPRDLSITRNILKFEGKDRVRYWRRFSALLALSVVIATMGLWRNSSAVIIAAMLIAPLMTPILGIASAVVMGWNGRALRLLLIVLAASLCAIGLAYAMMFISDAPRALSVPDEIRARTDPGVEDLIVALAAGAAGAYVQINRNEISLLPGAAIGVALVPPLSAAGILLYFGEGTLAWKSTLLFLTNLAAIVLSAGAVYVGTARRALLSNARKRLARFSLGFITTLVVLAVITVQLTRETISRFESTRLEAETARTILEWAGDVPVELLRIDVRPATRWAEVWVVVDLPLSAQNSLTTTAQMLPEQLDGQHLMANLRQTLGSGYTLAFRYQTRFAGAVSLVDGDVEDAPPVEDPQPEN